jgi:NADH dehydrogenase FAD-containing subunit
MSTSAVAASAYRAHSRSNEANEANVKITENSKNKNNSSNNNCYYNNKNKKIVIVGGGTAGVGIAAMLKNEGMTNVVVIEPRSDHYYQPLWTLVGAGLKSSQSSSKSMTDVLPTGVCLCKDSVKGFDPEKNEVFLDSGTTISYDYLVVAAGVKIDWDRTKGLVEGLSQHGSGVVSIYDYTYAGKTWLEFQQLKTKSDLTMIFTLPASPVKCAGAPQKIMWLLDDALRRFKLREGAKSISYYTPGTALFSIKHVAEKLEEIRIQRDVNAYYHQELVAIDNQKKVATFKDTETGKLQMQTFDLLHVTPHMSASDCIKQSKFADKDGWFDVDKHTLQSTRYENVFGIGDCTNTPTGKTAAAITAQAPVVIHNLQRKIDGIELNGFYDGYSSCPLLISSSKVMLIEFGYDGKVVETFGKEGKRPLSLAGYLSPSIQERLFYSLKSHVFPFAYWNLWIRGRWFGPCGIFKPDVTRKVDQEGK